MSRRLILATAALSVMAGSALGFYLGQPDDFVGTSGPMGPAAEYAYRCGDGSEFTLVPTPDLSLVRIIPATSSDYVPATSLESVPGGVHTTYADGSVQLLLREGVWELSVEGHEPTPCLPLQSETFLN
jgi:hypothetical protein